jgi:DNA-binding PadR family transcriptional regulator
MHLARLGRLSNDEIGVLGHTQRGMTESLGVPQGSVAKTLGRLEGAGVVVVDRRHVQGQPRRLKVYRLTSLGESVARDLLHPRASVRSDIDRTAPSQRVS